MKSRGCDKILTLNLITLVYDMAAVPGSVF